MTNLAEEFYPSVTQCATDLKYCAKFLFPEMFSRPFSQIHDKIIEKFNSKSQRVAIAAPRAIGKTSLSKLIIMRGLIFREFNFVVYIHNSATLAEMQTESIKRELIINPLANSIFGDIRGADFEGFKDDTFAKAAWVAYGNTLVLPRGSGQRVRGLLWGRHRPGLIVVDDLEDKEEVMNEEIRKKTKDWFFSDVMNAVDVYSDDWRVLYIDTLKHEDSQLQLLLDSQEWDSIRLSICDENYKSLAPDFISDETVARMVKEHKEKNILDVFYMEMMNLPVGGETAIFKKEHFKYYEESDLRTELKSKKRYLENVVILEPAKTIDPHSDDTAIIGIGIDSKANRLYIRDILHGKYYPDEMYNATFDMADRLGAKVIGYEVTSLNEFISQPLRNQMAMRGRFYELIDLKARGQSRAKEKRISSLSSYYRQGLVYHNPSCCGVLEQQLLSHPRSKRDDVADGTAYIVELLDSGDRYFDAPESSIEEEYKELELEDKEEALGQWRMI